MGAYTCDVGDAHMVKNRQNHCFYIFRGCICTPINVASPLVAVVTCAQATALIVLTLDRHARSHRPCPFHPSRLFLWPRGGHTSQQ